jgi:hypothetical protein
LQRELSRLSQSKESPELDLEKGRAAHDGSTAAHAGFDLESCLRGGLEAEQDAGIRPKHLGVLWDRLTVKGIGGSTNYVKTFPDAIIEFFDVVSPVVRLLKRNKKQTAEVTLLNEFRGVCMPGEMVLVLGVSEISHIKTIWFLKILNR